MDLSTYVESVRAGVQSAASLADDHTKHVAEQLGSAVESASRLALIQALSDAAAEISTELAPGSVDVRMSGTEPSFVVTLPSSHDDVTMLMPESTEEPAETADPLAVDGDEQQARISLRLPQSVKEKVDEYANADGVSTNTWLLHRVLEALAERNHPGRGRGQQSWGPPGWGINIGNDGVRLNMPPTPPTPPMPPSFAGGFGFGDRGRDRGERGDRGDLGDRGRGRRDGGPVQGWVK